VPLKMEKDVNQITTMAMEEIVLVVEDVSMLMLPAIAIVEEEGHETS